VGGALDRRRLALLALVVALNVVVIGAWAVRSERLMAAVGHPLPVTSLVPIVSFANTINNLTPASAGEAVRALILRRRHGVPYGRSTAVIVAERLWAHLDHGGQRRGRGGRDDPGGGAGPGGPSPGWWRCGRRVLRRRSGTRWGCGRRRSWPACWIGPVRR
jgi:hypothetical protein